MLLQVRLAIDFIRSRLPSGRIPRVFEALSPRDHIEHSSKSTRIPSQVRAARMLNTAFNLFFACRHIRH